MFTPKAFLALMAPLLIAGAVSAADTLDIDPVHSHIGFSVRHMVISNVKGNFTDFSGTIVYDTANLASSSVNVTIKAASINTDNAMRDKHLNSPDFFDTQKYPEITFQSKKIEKTDKGLVATGILTMHGVAREISFPFDIIGTTIGPDGKFRLGAEGGLTINRQDYGISWNKALDNGGIMVGDNVTIDLSVEAVKK